MARSSLWCGGVMMMGCVMGWGASVAMAQEASSGSTAKDETPPAGFVRVACEGAPERMACIEAGSFIRGADDRDTNARPAMKVWLSTYYMDQYEVTNAEYQACVKAGKCDVAGPRYGGYDGATQPVTGTNWFHAKKYCEAQGKSLPTEAQWEKAARGAEGEMNPWGNEAPTCERAIIMNARKERACGVKKPGTKPEAGRIWEIGQRPAWRYGLYDMSGNAQEWVQDWYTSSYAACGAACEGLDPKGPCHGEVECKGHNRRVLRGGSWYWPADHATGIHRRPSLPGSEPFHHFGFRCAASVEQARVLMKKNEGGR